MQARPTALRFDIDPAPPAPGGEGLGRLRAITAVSGWDGDVVDEVLWARPPASPPPPPLPVLAEVGHDSSSELDGHKSLRPVEL